MLKFFRISIFLTGLMALMTGCSDGGGSSDIKTGQLMFSGFSNLGYRTQTQEGVLDEAGTFKYREGETITFSLGEQVLVEDVPAHEYITFLEFGVDERAQLASGSVLNGLSTHTTDEETVANTDYINNLARFLYLMSDRAQSSGKTIDPVTISDRTIEQFNAYVEQNGFNIDFHVPVSEFEAEDSPANQLLSSICFFPEDSIACEEPPTQEEIDAAESKFNDKRELREDYDPEIPYKEDLQNKLNIIESNIRGTDDKPADFTAATLTKEATSIHEALSTRFYLSRFAAEIDEGDLTPQTVEIVSLDPGFEIHQLEVESLNETIAVIDNIDPESRTFTFLGVGSSGEETSILVNFQQVDDYRWYKKTLRVSIK